MTQKDKTLDLATSEDLARFLMNKLGKKQSKWSGIFEKDHESLRSDATAKYLLANLDLDLEKLEQLGLSQQNIP